MKLQTGNTSSKTKSKITNTGGHNADLDEAAKAAMLQFADLLEAKLPRVVRTCTLEPYYIFTDAAYSPDGEGSYCGIGGVCLDTRGVPLGFFSAELSGVQKALLVALMERELM